VNKVVLFFVLAALFFSGFLINSPIHAQMETEPPELQLLQPPVEPPQEETLEGEVIKVLEEKQITPSGTAVSQLYQKLEVLITDGSIKGKKVEIENGNFPVVNTPKFKIGDQLVVSFGKDFEGNDRFYITDYVRRSPLFWLFVIFVGLTVFIGRWQGASSLVGMAISFLVIFSFILPRISAGYDPVWIAILGAIVIIPATFFLSHGLNKKTWIAVAGTIIALVLTGIIANFFVYFAKLTGFASEEATFLQAYRPGVINIQGLLLAGIIIGVLGVLDDITISQSAVVQELKQANSQLKASDLYKRAMNVGRDHIASTVNTLVLVYTGAALPLLLLFIDSSRPFSQVVNYEIIAEEIVRTLVGSIGLILAVPITTLIAVYLSPKFTSRD